MRARRCSTSASTHSKRSPKTHCSTAAPCPRASKCWHTAWQARGGTHSKVIQRTRRFTKPKKARKPFFGTENSSLRNPKRVAKHRQTAFFGIRSRTVQYVKKVLKIIKYVQYRAREKTFVCLIAFSP